MNKPLKNLMYASAILDMVPWLLFSFTGVYIRVYIARHVDVDSFALVGMIETAVSCFSLQCISYERVIRFLKKNVMLLSLLGSCLDIVRALVLTTSPALALGLGAITGVIFCNLVSYGFREMTNHLYTSTDRTLFSVTCEKFGKLGTFISMFLAYIFKDLEIHTVVTILIISNCVVLLTDLTQFILYHRVSKELNVKI